MEQPVRRLRSCRAAWVVALGCTLACSTREPESPGDRFTADSVPASPRAADPPPDPGLGGEEPDAIASCYALDASCRAGGCPTLPSCCTLNTACCEPIADASIPPLVDFAGCAGTIESCGLESLRGFGSAQVREGRLAPDGMMADSGVVIGSPVDLRVHRVTVTAKLESTACRGTCVEAAGFGFAHAPLDGPLVRPVAALLASSDRRSVSLLVGDRIVASWPMTSDSETWSLAFEPSGRVLVDGPATAARFDGMPVARASLVAYGRNDALRETGARIDDIETAVELCDVPSAWNARETIALAPTAVDSPSVFGEVIAWADRGSIYAADLDGTVWNQGDPILVGTQFHDEGGVSDPEIVFRAGEWNLFYTATSHNGIRSIGRAVASVPGPFVPDGSPVLQAAAARDEEGLDMPTVAEVFDGRWVLIARVRSPENRTSLESFVSTDGKTFVRLGGALPATTTRSAGGPSLAFDAHEVADPSLVIVNGAYHLFFAGRRGTRSSIGLLLSDDLRFWRAIDGAVLEPDGAIDRVGVRAPDAMVDASGVVHLYYVGDDGHGRLLRRTSRIAPTHMGGP
jgi:predicted GH43/DUF377 family glycosyl hydrolase